MITYITDQQNGEPDILTPHQYETLIISSLAGKELLNRLKKLPVDARIHEMSVWLYKTMPADEAYWCTSERLRELAIQNLYQLDLALSPPE